MATLYIAEFTELERITGLPGDIAQVAAMAPIVEQTVSISGSHAESAAFNTATKFVRLHTDAICSVAFGSAPAATTSNARLAANQTEYFGIYPGNKVSVITNT